MADGKEKGVRMFRYKKGIPLDYNTQGYVYFLSRRYDRLSEREKRKVRRLCQIAGKEHAEAVLDAVTGKGDPAAICARHYLSQSSLERKIKKYYMLWK